MTASSLRIRWLAVLTVLAIAVVLSACSDSPAPTSEPTATPSATPRSEPTATATATSEPTPTAKATPSTTPRPEPTATATATSEPTPTARATPSATPTPEPTVAATATSEPTPTARATSSATPTPGPTAAATAASEPTPTARATSTATPRPEPTAAATPTPTPISTATSSSARDRDGDGLIEVDNLTQLDAMRWDTDGDGMSDNADYAAAFSNAGTGTRCSVAGCSGYELTANLDFDTNGNGEADDGDVYWNSGGGWIPIGESNDPFGTTFEGGGHTISNLYIRRSPRCRSVRECSVLGAPSRVLGWWTQTWRLPDSELPVRSLELATASLRTVLLMVSLLVVLTRSADWLASITVALRTIAPLSKSIASAESGAVHPAPAGVPAMPVVVAWLGKTAEQ